jgi:hypothetical protein
LADEVGEACAALTRQLKGITATYRMTTKGPPSRHSHYVTSLLGPLRAALEAPRAARLPQGTQRRMVARVVEVVTAKYQVNKCMLKDIRI